MYYCSSLLHESWHPGYVIDENERQKRAPSGLSHARWSEQIEHHVLICSASFAVEWGSNEIRKESKPLG